MGVCAVAGVSLRHRDQDCTFPLTNHSTECMDFNLWKTSRPPPASLRYVTFSFPLGQTLALGSCSSTSPFVHDNSPQSQQQNSLETAEDQQGRKVTVSYC